MKKKIHIQNDNYEYLTNYHCKTDAKLKLNLITNNRIVREELNH